MRLILSCITKGEDQLRGLLDHLAQAGIAKQAIVVLHPDHGNEPGEQRMLSRLAPADLAPATTPGETPASAAGAVTSAGGIGGMFGWVLGYGVLSLPGALLGGAVGAVAGAAIGATRHALTPHPHVTEDVQHHYASRIIGDHAAVLVQVQEMQQYETVLRAFLDEGGRHILTSRNDPAVAESAQLEVLTHHPVLADEPIPEVGSAVSPADRS